MIITITGKVTHKSTDWAVIETAGIGHRVFATAAVLESLKLGQEARLWTHEHLREDGRELFGFGTLAELELFGKLLAISGIGPRVALNILALGSVKEIERAVDKGDIDLLSRVPRVGRKTAQKIILELKGKLVDLGGDAEEQDVLTALVGMGYDRDVARDALQRAGKAADDGVEKRLKAALKELGRKR